MTNVEKLLDNHQSVLGAVRKRLGGNDENDDSFDSEINEMTSSEIVEAWTGWHLGDGSWWTEMKFIFDNLESR